MARNFNGTSDKATITAGVTATVVNCIPGTNGSTLRRSHPVPFVLANGNILLGFCSNEDGTNFVWKCATSTDGGATFGSAVFIGGNASGGTDTFDGSFCQLSGGVVFCVYGFDNDVKYRTSTDNGASWSAESTIINNVDAQPHPSCALKGSTLTVVYGNASIEAKQATVTSSSVGAFGTAITVKSGSSAHNPNIAVAPDGELIVSYSSSSNSCKVIRSTDSGVGSAWGSEISPTATDTGSANADPNLIIDGSIVWLVFPVGTDQTGTYPSVTPGNRVPYVQASLDNGATWSTAAAIYTTTATDFHRTNGCIIGGVPVVFGAAIDGDTDYHLDRLTIDDGALANVRAGYNPVTINNQQKFTMWGWVRNDGTLNAASNQFVMFKGSTTAKAFQYGNVSGGTKNFACFVARATTNTQYKTADNILTSNTWTFFAITFDDTRGNTARCEVYKGTTPSNLASLSLTVVSEGSGAINSDSDTSLLIGSRSSDGARCWRGDLGKVGYAIGVLTLTQLQAIMRGSLPSAPTLIASYVLDGTVVDLSNNDNDGTYSGTTAASSDPPTFGGGALIGGSLTNGSMLIGGNLVQS